MLTHDPYHINKFSIRTYFNNIGYKLVQLDQNLEKMIINCIITKKSTKSSYTVILPSNIIYPDLPNYIQQFYPELLI